MNDMNRQSDEPDDMKRVHLPSHLHRIISHITDHDAHKSISSRDAWSPCMFPYNLEYIGFHRYLPFLFDFQTRKVNVPITESHSDDNNDDDGMSGGKRKYVKKKIVENSGNSNADDKAHIRHNCDWLSVNRNNEMKGKWGTDERWQNIFIAICWHRTDFEMVENVIRHRTMGATAPVVCIFNYRRCDSPFCVDCLSVISLN